MTIHSIAPAQPVHDYSAAWAKIRAVQAGQPLTPPCTHAGITQAHLDECCADGVQCDMCGDDTGIDPATLELGEAALCGRCQVLDMDGGE